MSSSTGRDPSDPKEWLRRARSNLARAKFQDHPDVLLEDLCFDAQQAAEKALKAILVSRQYAFPKTHSIRELLGLVDQAGVKIPDEIRPAVELTVFAVAGRYPGFDEDVTPEEHARALDLAVSVVTWASKVIYG